MKFLSPFKRNIRTIHASTFAILLASGHARSATTVQEETFSFLPNASALMTFQRFDTMGGTRTLDSVFVEIQYTRNGGYAQFDNESPTTATVNLTSRIDMFVTAGVDLTKLGSSTGVGAFPSLRTTASQSTTLGPDDDPEDNNFNYGGDDFFHWDLPELSVSDSGFMDDTEQFVGTDSFDIDLEGLQSESITGVSGAKKTTSPSSVFGFAKLTFNYTVTPIPELNEWVLGPLGLALIVLVRRQR